LKLEERNQHENEKSELKDKKIKGAKREKKTSYRINVGNCVVSFFYEVSVR
jgi:hypothetical protein